MLSKPAIAVHIIFVIGLACLVYGFFIEAYRVEVNHFTIETDKLKNTSFRIVHFTDTHCDQKMRNEQKLVEVVKMLNPDVVVFTGDALNTEKAISLFKDTMTALEAKSAKLAIRGNWDTRVGKLKLYEGTGFELLSTEKKQIEKNGEKISVFGPGSLNFPDNSSAKTNPANTYNIFLYHTPDLVEDIQDKNIDLYLCGHTHGGQIALPFYGAIITFSEFGKKYEAGMYDVGDTVLYTNRGLGMEGGKAPRARFCARPEISVFDIVPVKSD